MPYPVAAVRGGLGQGGAASALTFLLRDDFTTTASAPLTSPRTAEPGPGTLTITDTNNKLSISGGKLSFATGGVGAGDPGVWGAVLTRAIGRAVVAKANLSVNGLEIGWDSAQSGSVFDSIRLISGTSNVRDAGTAIATDATTTGVDYSLAVIQRTAGYLAFIKGGAYTNWTLMWVGVGSASGVYPSVGAVSNTAVGTADNFRVLDLPTPFDTDYGLATQRLSGARSVSDAFTHTADCVLEYTVTNIGTSSNTFVLFRQQDASNYWRMSVQASDGSLVLAEVVAGTPTTRGSSVGAVVNGNRIVIVADGSTIRGYSNNVLKFTYSSASNFATSTAGQLSQFANGGGAVSDIVSWPRQLSGTAASLLDASVA